MSAPPDISPLILTLSPEEIQRFLVRTRRERDVERWENRLDVQLREILKRANQFVPSEAGSILLDDPRAKLAGGPLASRLTFIACFGEGARKIIGTRIPSDRGIAGHIYQHGVPYLTDRAQGDPHFAGDTDSTSGYRTKSIVGVPVIVGESICGVLELLNRVGGAPYSARDLELLQIFAGYISSSIQNALDAVRARELARRDDLTGLFNDRFFHGRLREEIERAEHDNTDISLLFMDLDAFKQINDKHGHLAGSRTLREVGGVLITQSPPGAIAARYGGDEFVIILPGVDGARALAIAEVIRHRIAETTFIGTPSPDGAPPLRLVGITASFGIASYHEHLAAGGTIDERQNRFLRLADEAMYEAKARGKNQTVVTEPE
jgi:diguanylate cyclase (GGDEF)-like protein